MSLFDILGGNKENTVVFETIPASLDEFKALPQAALSTPYDTAALTVLAFTVYPSDRDAALAMLDYLRGPRPMSPMDKQFIRDRFMEGAHDVPRSYFAGAVPENDYTPSSYSVDMKESAYAEEGYKKFDVKSGGADSPRQVVLRSKPSTGQWFLWDQFLLSGIRKPKSQDEWA